MSAEPRSDAPTPALYADYQDAGPPVETVAPARTARSDILDGPLRRAILRLAGPAVGTTLFQVLFNITDTFWVGRTLGATALAGVSVASYTIWVMVSLGELLGVGLTAVASRRHGEGDPAAAARATGTALAMAGLLGLVLAVGGIAGLPAIFALMQAPADASAVARDFLVVQLAGAVLVYGYYVVAAAFRSAGDTRTPFLLLGGSVLLNLVLDPAMILGWGPIPRLGVYGAALATVLTRGLAFLVGIVLLARRGGVRPAFQPAVVRSVLSIGLPTMLTGVLFSLIYMLLVRVTAVFGAPALAALGVGHKIEGICYMITLGFAAAAQATVGQNLGAAQPERARAAGWLTARLAAVPTACFGLLFLVFPEPLARVFSDDPAVVSAAVLYLRIVAVAQIATAFENVLEGALGGAGYTFWPALWVMTLSVVRIPLASWAALRFGLAGIWWVLAVTAIGRGLVMAAMWRWGGWERARA